MIAVALFAALSYAITQSGRGGGSISREQAAIDAAQIVQAMVSIQTGVQRMILMGIPAADIQAGDPPDTALPGVGSDNGGPSFCTTGENCLFAPEGGSVSLPQIPISALAHGGNPSWFGAQTAFEGANGYKGWHFHGIDGDGDWNVAVPGVGTEAGDDVVVVYPLKREVCVAINKGLGIDDDVLDQDVYDLPAPAPLSRCVKPSVSDGTEYSYYHVLVAY